MNQDPQMLAQEYMKMKKENKTMKKVNEKNKQFRKIMTEDHNKLNQIIDQKQAKVDRGNAKIINLIEAKTEKEQEAEDLGREKDQLKVIIAQKQLRIEELQKDI